MKHSPQWLIFSTSASDDLADVRFDGFFVFSFFFFGSLLDKSSHLYKRVCTSVEWMDGPSNGWSVTKFYIPHINHGGPDFALLG